MTAAARLLVAASLVVTAAGVPDPCMPWAQRLFDSDVRITQRQRRDAVIVATCNPWLNIVSSKQHVSPLYVAFDMDGLEQRLARGGLDSFVLDGRVSPDFQAASSHSAFGPHAGSPIATAPGCKLLAANRALLVASKYESFPVPDMGEGAASPRKATFVMTNIAPQAASLNERAWRMLEQNISDFAAINDLFDFRLLVGVAFEQFDGKHTTPVVDSVHVPSHFFYIMSHEGECTARLAINADECDGVQGPQQVVEVSVTDLFDRLPSLLKTHFSGRAAVEDALGGCSRGALSLDISGLHDAAANAREIAQLYDRLPEGDSQWALAQQEARVVQFVIDNIRRETQLKQWAMKLPAEGVFAERHISTEREVADQQIVCGDWICTAQETAKRQPLWSAYTAHSKIAVLAKGGFDSFIVDERLHRDEQLRMQSNVFGAVSGLNAKVGGKLRDYLYAWVGCTIEAFDRGQLAPSKLLSASGAMHQSTYLITNVAPQAAKFSRQSWRLLERRVFLALAAGKAMTYRIVTGVATELGVLSDYGQLAIEGTAVPTHFWKIVSEPASGKCVLFVATNCDESADKDIPAHPVNTLFRLLPSLSKKVSASFAADALSCKDGADEVLDIPPGDESHQQAAQNMQGALARELNAMAKAYNAAGKAERPLRRDATPEAASGDRGAADLSIADYNVEGVDRSAAQLREEESEEEEWAVGSLTKPVGFHDTKLHSTLDAFDDDEEHPHEAGGWLAPIMEEDEHDDGDDDGIEHADLRGDSGPGSGVDRLAEKDAASYTTFRQGTTTVSASGTGNRGPAPRSASVHTTKAVQIEGLRSAPPVQPAGAPRNKIREPQKRIKASSFLKRHWKSLAIAGGSLVGAVSIGITAVLLTHR